LFALKGLTINQDKFMSIKPEDLLKPALQVPTMCFLTTKSARKFASFSNPKRYALMSDSLPESDNSLDDPNKVVPPALAADTEYSSDSSLNSYTPSKGGNPVYFGDDKSDIKEHLEQTKRTNSGSSIISRTIFTFSEGRIVFDRLAAAFWPGSLTIVVPFNFSASLPKSILLEMTCMGNLKDTTNMCVALRCPSHPLCKRFIKEIGIPIVSFAAGTADSPCTMSRHVQSIISPFALKDEISLKCVIPCINGEDRRETFFVPSCQQGQEDPIIFLDESARTIHLLTRQANISKDGIYSALLKSSSAQYGCTANKGSSCPNHCKSSQTVKAVLRKWLVLEY